MGYANECGEALRSLLPPFGVPASYAVAIGYVLCDTVDKAKKEWEVSAVCKTDPSNAMRVVRVASSAFDALSWQLLASVFVPGSIIHFAYTVTSFAVSLAVSDDAAVAANPGAAAAAAAAGPAVSSLVASYLPTVVGLGTIPLIVEPIDEAIHKVHDMSIRPALSSSIESFNKFESSLLSTAAPGAAGDAQDDAPGEAVEEQARELDVGATLRGGAALAMAVTFAPLAFSVSDVIDSLH